MGAALSSGRPFLHAFMIAVSCFRIDGPERWAWTLLHPSLVNRWPISAMVPHVPLSANSKARLTVFLSSIAFAPGAASVIIDGI